MEVYAAVRRYVLLEGHSRREAAGVFGLSRDTIAKMCRFSVPPGYQRTKPPEKPKLGPLTPVIWIVVSDGSPQTLGPPPERRHGQSAEDFGRRKRCVMKEDHPDVGAQPLQQTRHQPQVVVMDPDRRAERCLLSCTLGKPLVYALVEMPAIDIEVHLVGNRHQDRPQRVLAKAMIERLIFLLRKRYSD